MPICRAILIVREHRIMVGSCEVELIGKGHVHRRTSALMKL